MGSKKNLLVFLVEDDPFYLKVLEGYFATKSDYKVKSFSSGEDCLANLNQKPDLVILDYFLDKSEGVAMDGKHVYKKIKEISHASKIIMLSGQQSADIVFDLIKDGVRNYVIKNKETFEELDQILEEYALN